MNKHLFPLAMALAATSCVYPAERGKMLEARVHQLESDKASLEASLLAQRETIEAQLPLVQEALNKLEAASRRTNADTGVQVEELQGIIASLRGQLEEQTFRMAQLEDALNALKTAPPPPPAPHPLAPESVPAVADVANASPGQPAAPAPSESVPPAAPAAPTPPPAPVVQAKATPPQPAPAASPAPKPPAEKPIDKSNRQAFADAVVKKLKADPAAGRKLADEFLGKWPKHALAAQIHYEVGMSHLGEKSYRAALSEFGVFIQPDMPKAFTSSQWAPEALLRSADCFAALRMTREAGMALEEVINAYPKSRAAKEARERLDAQKKGKAKSKKK